MTTIEFAQKIKSKYPEYQDLPDDQLAQKMLAKYPQYQSQITESPKQEPKKGLGQKILDVGTKVSDTLGFKGTSDYLGTVGANLAHPKMASEGLIPEPTLKQAVGSGVHLGATVAGGGGAGVAGKFAQRVLANLGLGAAIGGGSMAAEGGTPTEIAKSAGATGAVGAVIPFVGKGLRTIGAQIDNLPTRFVESALGRSKAQILAEAKKGPDTLARYVMEWKPIGTAESMLQKAEEAIERIGNEVQEKIAASVTKRGFPVTVGRDNFLDSIAKIPEAQGALLKRADVREVIERLAPQTKEIFLRSSWSLPEANKLRQLLDKTLGDRGFLAAQLSNDKTILRTFANQLRETVKSRAPESVRQSFAELSKEIQLREALAGKIAQKAGNQVLSFGDFIGGGLGGVMGSVISNPILGAAAGIGARRAIESVPVKIGTAKFIETLTRVGPVLDQSSPAVQTAILELLSAISAPDSTSEDDQQEGFRLQI